MKQKKTKREEEYWLALARAPSVGPVTFAKLIKHFGEPAQVFTAGQSEWQALNIKGELFNYLKNPDWQSVENDLRWLTQPGNHILLLNQPDYPKRLQEIHDPPPVLFVHGDCALLSTEQLAIVGTRNPSRSAEDTALEFAEYLSLAGLTITSGLAFGIDAASHRGALAGSGKTIAVAATGLDRVYPPQHRELAHRIAENGALVSEFPPGTAAKPSNFPRRNRIISGMSLGTLIVEAGKQSGALITARQAVEQGREVFAIPGSIHNPLARGCHALIKEGAKLVETATDIIEELLVHLPPSVTSKNLLPVPTKAIKKKESGALTSKTSKSSKPLTEATDLEPTYRHLLDYLRETPTSVDSLVELSGLTAGEVSSMLLILEMRGWVAAQSGGLYIRIR